MGYKVALTCGYVSARVECLFSSMVYVDAARRRHNTPFRESALTHFFFLKDPAREISFEEFSVVVCCLLFVVCCCLLYFE